MEQGLARRSIGMTPLRVTEIGFGGAPLGSVGTAIDEAASDEIVHAALAAGINYFDTAPYYGHGLSERRLGRVLAPAARDSFVLSTKVGRLLVPRGTGSRNEGMGDDEPYDFRYDYSADAVRRSIDESLVRLGLDRIDIAYLHDIDIWTHGDNHPAVRAEAFAGALPALIELRRQGVVTAVGIGVNEALICREVIDEFDIDAILLAGRFTLLEQDSVDVVVDECARRSVSVVIGGPYNSGLLAVADRGRATYDYQAVDDERWERAQAIRAVCDRHGVDLRAAALQYPLRHRATACVIPGVRKPRELGENLAFMNDDVPDALWADLAEAGLARALPG